MLRSLAILTAALLAVLAAPAAAPASSDQESLFQDDAALLSWDTEVQTKTLREVDRLGADVIRANFIWSAIAPKPNRKTKPRHFDASDPGDYPESNWWRFDNLVRGAAERGIELQITLTGFIPAWASDCNGSVKLRHVCRPNPREFGKFTAAVAKRYSGDYGLFLPKVRRWSIWNEPNQAGWLYPQLSRRHGVIRPEAPRRYRALAYAAVDALRRNGHKHDQIMLGETAPLGRRFGSPGNLNIAPVAFWRETLCINARGGPLRGATGRALGCKRRFRQLRVTAASHHPYTRGGAGSPRSFIGPEDVTLASIGRLERVLNQARHRRRVPRRLPIYLTEYGFQTNPPDRYSGVSPRRAATWLNESDWMAFRNPRIKSVAQYELRDERPINSFQTGLRFHSGRAKPGYHAYRVPIWVTRRNGRTLVWGQVRAGGVGDRVEIRYQPRRGAGWRRLKTITVGNARGYFTVRTRRNAYRWRLAWKKGGTKLSRAAVPSPY